MTQDSFHALRGEEIACAVVIGSTIGFWITMLIIVYVCNKIRRPKNSPLLEYTRVNLIQSDVNLNNEAANPINEQVKAPENQPQKSVKREVSKQKD